MVMPQKTPREAIQSDIEDLGKKKMLGIVFNGYNKAHKSCRKYYKKYYEKKRSIQDRKPLIKFQNSKPK